MLSRKVTDVATKLSLEINLVWMKNTTRQILTQLLSEYKIEYIENGICEYSVMKTAKVSTKRKFTTEK